MVWVIITEAFVDQALRTYIAQFRREKIQAENKAFDQQRETLLAKYPGQKEMR